MNTMNLADVASATGGHIIADGADARAREALGSLEMCAVSTDTRAMVPQALFVALRGEHFDGHAFVAAATSEQMVAAVVDEAGNRALAQAAVPRVVVADTTVALGDLARWHRRRMARPVAAITGSNGKTTAKEMLAQALTLRGPVHKTPGNLNNLVGLPLTVFAWPDAAWAAVLEMGMNAPGEIARLTAIAEPQVGLITCVAAAHLQGLGTLERVARAKVELLQGLPAGATAIINGDDMPLSAAAAPYLTGRPSLRFGTQASCDVRLLAAEHVLTGEMPALSVTLLVDNQRHQAVLPVVGRHNGMNAAAAVAAAVALGLGPGEALSSMRHVHIPGARGRVVHNAHDNVWLLDDCYNANPQSMAAALSTLQDLARGATTVAILGDMLELGEGAQDHHRELGRAAAAAGMTQVIALGAWAQDTALGARAAGAQALAFPIDAAPKDVARAARKHLPAKAWCLVKGSRGMRLERVVHELMASHP